MSAGVSSQLKVSGEVLVLTASDDCMPHGMGHFAPMPQPTYRETVSAHLHSLGLLYKSQEEARVKLQQDPTKTLAIWPQEIVKWGVLLREDAGWVPHLYDIFPEYLSDFLECDKTLRELARAGAVTSSYEEAQRIFKADPSKTLVAWLSKSSLYQSFRVLERLHPADNPKFRSSLPINFHDFPHIVEEHKARVAPASSFHELAFGRMGGILQQLQAQGRYFASRAEALSDLKSDHTKAFAVWKSESDPTKYGMYLHMFKDDPGEPYKVSQEQLPLYVECAEVVSSLAAQGLCVKNRAEAAALMQRGSDTTVVAWAELVETKRRFYLLTRLPKGQIAMTQGIPITEFAQAVRDHHAQVRWNSLMVSRK